jgi:hypothetical protein
LAVFYLPLDHAAFVAANPAFRDLPAPPESGLRFDERCLSCGVGTRHIETTVSGAGHGREREEYEQPIPLCPPCVAAQSSTREKAKTIRITRAVGALVFATFISTVLRIGMGASEIASIATWWAVALAVYALSGSFYTFRPVAPWQEVEIIWFRDPRKGEGAEFLCVHIDNDGQARRFADLNPHSIPADRWDDSYLRASVAKRH